MDMNSVSLVGRLTDNVSFTPKNGDETARAWFRLAVNRPTRKDQLKQADFITCVAWGVNAENLAKYTELGQEVGIRGSIRTNHTPNPDGSYNNYTEVSVAFCSYGQKSKKSQAAAQATPLAKELAQVLGSLDDVARGALQNLSDEDLRTALTEMATTQ
ncbi:MAG TPA: single-stranded DNA-binding protein [bacterium]|nr:single-stranded DNA-binding protein [bacterium]